MYIRLNPTSVRRKNPLRSPVLLKFVLPQICETYMKVYEFSPQDTWGTAPVEIQDSWHYLVSYIHTL